MAVVVVARMLQVAMLQQHGLDVSNMCDPNPCTEQGYDMGVCQPVDVHTNPYKYKCSCNDGWKMKDRTSSISGIWMQHGQVLVQFDPSCRRLPPISSLIHGACYFCLRLVRTSMR